MTFFKKKELMKVTGYSNLSASIGGLSPHDWFGIWGGDKLTLGSYFKVKLMVWQS